MLSPRPSLVSIGGYKNRGIVNKVAHAGRRTLLGGPSSCALTLRRASSISASVNRPCCFSHSATAASPARRCRTSRAAAVIQAETLTPSRVAAERMCSCILGSTVIASCGDGLPREMKVSCHGRIHWTPFQCLFRTTKGNGGSSQPPGFDATVFFATRRWWRH